MERLGHLIEQEVGSGSWKLIKVNGMGISPLFFANNLFLFGRTTEAQDNVMKRVLDKFLTASGGLEKSKL